MQEKDFKRLDVRAIIRAVYMAYYSSEAQSFRKHVLPLCENDRKDGFSDALGQLAEDSEGLGTQALERWRVEASKMQRDFRQQIIRGFSSSAVSAMAHDYLIKLDIVITIICFVWFAFVWRFMVFLVPVAVIVIAKAQRAIFAPYLVHRAHTIYYKYGYSEGITYLSDKHGIEKVDILTPLKF